MPAFARCENNLLVIGNDALERRLHAQVGEPLRMLSFINRASGRDYARASSREFSFSANGRHLTTDDFRLVRVDIRAGDPVEVSAHLQGDDLALEFHLQAYADHPVLRQWLVLHNSGQQTLSIRDLDWLALKLRVDTAATTEVWVDYASRREKSVAITMDDCVFIINDPVHREGFVFATEAPGPLKRLEAYADGDRIAAGYNRDDETIFERILQPGESFRTAASFILPYANPIPQDVIDGAYARFVAEHLTVCNVARVPTIALNTWVPFGSNIDRAVVLPEIEIAAELGVDAYQLDDGWYDRMGDWNVNLTRFPHRLEEIVDLLHAHGMRFGLWMGIATVSEESRVFQEHPEWIARDRTGQPNRHPIAGTATMCLDSDYYDYILAKMDDIAGRYDVELLKLDLSVVRNVYAPGQYPGCYADNHHHRSHDESHLRLMERMFELVRALKLKHPRCLVDLSYEAYGIMDGTDLALIQVADQNWFTNLASPNEVSFRREVYQRGRITPPWTLNFGGAVLDAPSAPAYGLFSTLASHALFWGALSDLDEATRAHYRRWFAWIKAQRARDDFYRYYRVSNVFPAPDGISSRDFRHGIPAARYGIAPLGIHYPAFEPASEHLGEIWDGVARLNERGEGPIFLFRPGASISPFFQLHIPWVDPSAEYTVDLVTADQSLGVFRGSDLIETGISIHLPERATASVITLTRV